MKIHFSFDYGYKNIYSGETEDVYKRQAHIGEVQVSVWDDNTYDACRKAGIPLL